MSATSPATAPGAPVEFDRLPPAWSPSANVRPKLPVGVAILAVLIAFLAVAMVLTGALFALNVLFPSAVPASLEIFPAIDLEGAGILVVLGVALLVVATSLWRQETWALWITIVLVFAATAYLFFTGSITILFLVFVVLLVYLLAVRRYFY
ncbi:MAG TPA: hypothetical protein VMG36_03725 [Thermoplasmata archaeon]|nr:hypothetical protein [Thermoplasmata archaeon]